MYGLKLHDKIIAEGHRGYCAKYPENTLVSFKGAMDLGVDQIEFDVWLSKDGVPVIMHDQNAKRTTGVDKLITDMTLEEIKTLDAGSHFDEKFKGEKVPTLRETLDLLSTDPKMLYGVEIKGRDVRCADVTIEMLREYGIVDRCWFYTWNCVVLKHLKTKYGDEVRTMAYPDFTMQDIEQVPEFYDYRDEVGIGNYFLSKALCTKIQTQDKKRMRMFCMDNEEDVIDAIEHGASAITANDPVPLLKYLNEHNMRIDKDNFIV